MADFTITLKETGGAFNAEFGEYISGGSSVTVSPLTVTENGTYNAGTNAAYNPVTVDVADGAVALIEGTASEIPDDITSIRDMACAYMPNLTEVSLPALTEMGSYAFTNCNNLTRFEAPNLETATQTGRQFNSCTSLTYADVGYIPRIMNAMFTNDSALTSVVLRYQGVVNFRTDAFTGTPIESGTGYIYVPDDLVDTYKSATGWSTHASQIKGISELPTT